ncbi:UDP-N-acetylmuramate dehydrogenase [Bordetella holmesii]|uniref:UDP-N-acetylenolpyruvoylglucosamine reductase n=1 Tax=Bordetella holmesii 1058 TaxID=1247648 RepID=A0ABP3BLQ1_9BORD|nr:UDP-N-acetylmuramate dehydrogenase [Bordetella holmesii]AHV92962.1 UDP-N-acetylenolpyruvoylglucosamine reductase [Bordetella holmesii ATCC 51541]AIT24935.1 UDP-N-acetylenolpyruvoylglucosamine reductase [Bordetella holmesii 44057]AMD50268.1 UDP-N-acetylenolpyruvoylglucosamine reductase [Bordetella holmesii F627]EXF90171.1 UDP-N-acetylenolpyruvoylglucosamine reductase [Bordetella holmesii 30539]EXF90189.1 UDP-N-acetylenolpyruvoylglucosamine reductase [Bordetella holmesii 30539]
MSISLVPTNQDLRDLNTFRLASRAAAFVTLDDEAQLPAVSAWLARYPGCLVLGGGSNVVLGEVLSDLVVKVGLRGIRLLQTRDDAWLVEAAAGERWHDFVAHCTEQGWAGLENLALIPGTVGAAPVQNIGAYGVELADRFDSLDAWDLQQGRAVRFEARDCRFAYRDSVFKQQPGRWLITRVRFALPRPWRAVLNYPDLQRWPALQQAEVDARTIFQAVCAIRQAKLPDPAVIGNAGSFFKNPLVDATVRESLLARYPELVSYAQPDGRYKLAAGWLIDQCGWKGRDLGPAGVHDRQALVLVNRGAATARDILALADAIRTDVQGRFGVWLEPEPVVVA